MMQTLFTLFVSLAKIAIGILVVLTTMGIVGRTIIEVLGLKPNQSHAPKDAQRPTAISVPSKLVRRAIRQLKPENRRQVIDRYAVLISKQTTTSLNASLQNAVVHTRAFRHRQYQMTINDTPTGTVIRYTKTGTVKPKYEVTLRTPQQTSSGSTVMREILEGALE